MPVPAPKTNEILRRLEALPLEVGCQDFLVRQIKAEIGTLRTVNAAEAFMLEGILNAKLFDLKGAKEAHEKSIKLAPGQDNILWNYSASLSSFAHYAEARPLVGRILSAGYIKVEYVHSALWLSLLTLDVDDFFQCLRDYAHKVREALLQEAVDDMKQSAGVIHAFTNDFPGVKQGVDRLYHHVQAVLEESRESLVGFEAKEDNFYGQRVLHIDYGVESAEEKIISMNDSLLERVSADEEFEHWDTLIASFVLVEPEEEQQGKVEYAGHA